MRKITGIRLGAAAFGLLASGFATHAETLTMYCGSDEVWCQQTARGFEEATGITVDMTRKSAGEVYAQIRAEAKNPKGDVWWAGTGDPHLQAAEEGLTEEYKSSLLDQLQPWAIKQAEAANFRTVGIYSGALGFGYNKDLLAKNKLPEPKCWADLTKPEYKGQIQVANPNSSGTAYTLLATIVQIMGEDKGFEYLKALHKNVNQYTKSGSAPIKAAGLGETTIGIVFIHDAVSQAVAGFPIVPVTPCEGTGYEIGSMSLIKGARHPEAAKKFYDWALQADVQSKAQDAGSFQVPSNKSAKTSDKAPDLSTIKLIDYDFKKYGSSEERKRLLKKWDEEVASLPQ